MIWINDLMRSKHKLEKNQKGEIKEKHIRHESTQERSAAGGEQVNVSAGKMIIAVGTGKTD